MIAPDKVRCGGRSARIQASVHQAVEALSRERERAELTVPLIAVRAGVTPSTIYRRWGDLAGLLADVAVDRLRPSGDPAETGALATDLRAWVEQFMDEMASEPGRAMIRDVLANAPDLACAARCSDYTSGQLRIICDRATGRREDTVEIAQIIDHVVAPIMYRILFGATPPDNAYCHALIDAVLPQAIVAMATDSDAPDGSRRSDPRAPG